jgi:hypothetical protein
MKIDSTVLTMIDRGVPPDDLFQALLQGAAEVETTLLGQIAAEAIGDGWDENSVRSEIERQSCLLAASREQRFGNIRELLEARARLQ